MLGLIVKVVPLDNFTFHLNVPIVSCELKFKIFKVSKNKFVRLFMFILPISTYRIQKSSHDLKKNLLIFIEVRFVKIQSKNYIVLFIFFTSPCFALRRS